MYYYQINGKVMLPAKSAGHPGNYIYYFSAPAGKILPIGISDVVQAVQSILRSFSRYR